MGGIYNPPAGGGGGQPSDPFTLGTAPNTLTESSGGIVLTDGTFTTTLDLPLNEASRVADSRRYEMAHSTLGYFDADSVAYMEPNAFSVDNAINRFQATTDSIYVRNAAGTVGVQLNADGSIQIDGNPTRQVLQQVEVSTGALVQNNGTIPYDNSIPQIGEGYEYLSSGAFTPKRSTSVIVVEAIFNGGNSTANNLTAAIFQSGVNDALDAKEINNTTGLNQLVLYAKLAAGSTAARTYSLRAGGAGASTTYLNGASGIGGQAFGGACMSFIRVTEYDR